MQVNNYIFMDVVGERKGNCNKGGLFPLSARLLIAHPEKMKWLFQPEDN